MEPQTRVWRAAPRQGSFTRERGSTRRIRDPRGLWPRKASAAAPAASSNATASIAADNDEFATATTPEPYSELGMRRMVDMLDFSMNRRLLIMNERDRHWRDIGMALHHLDQNGWPRMRELWDFASKLAQPRESDGGGVYDEEMQETRHGGASIVGSTGGRLPSRPFFNRAIKAGWVWDGGDQHVPMKPSVETVDAIFERAKSRCWSAVRARVFGSYSSASSERPAGIHAQA